MTTALVVAYIVASYAAMGWFAHTQLDGVLKLIGWLMWLVSPITFPYLAFHWFRGWLAR